MFDTVSIQDILAAAAFVTSAGLGFIAGLLS